MNPVHLEHLLFEDESVTLDFKRDQYPFSKVDEDTRSELLKDILGFANAFRRSDALIVIGVEDVVGGRGIVHGISEHLADHAMQQFVNNLTNRPVNFSYQACEIDGHQVGVIQIDQEQARPVVLKRDFGKLMRNEVYVRRGSSTDPQKPALPDEIAQMGAMRNPAVEPARVCIEFADPDVDVALGTEIVHQGEYVLMPDQLPPFPQFRRQHQLMAPMSEDNKSFYRQFADYEFCRRMLRRFRFVVENTGRTTANAVRVELQIPKERPLLVCERLPDAPVARRSLLRSTDALRGVNALQGVVASARRSDGDVCVSESDDRYKLEIDVSSLQPGRRIWTGEFFMGFGDSISHSLAGAIFAENIPQPIPVELKVDAQIIGSSMSRDEIVRIADASRAE